MNKLPIYPVFVATIVALGGFLLGFDGVVNGGAVPFYRVSFGISDSPLLIGLSSSAIILGAIFGNFTVGYIIDKIGCKPSLILTSILFMVGAGGTAIAPSIIPFIICKFTAGLGVGIAILVAPMIIAEVAPPKQRGWLVSFNQLNIVIGLSTAMLSNYFILQTITDPNLNWRWMLGVGFFPAALYFFLLFLIPESPRWLIMKGRDEEGLNVLVKAGGEKHAREEFDKIKANLSNQNTEQKSGLKELFSTKMRFVLFLGLGLAVLQQLSGINAVLYYAPMIFESAGTGLDAAFLMAIVVGAAFTVSTIISMFLIDRMGRRPLLLIGSAIMTVSFLVVSFAFTQASYKLDNTAIQGIENNLLKQYENEEITSVNDLDSSENEELNVISVGQKEPQNVANKSEVDTKMLDQSLIQVLREVENQNFTEETKFFNALKVSLVNKYSHNKESFIKAKFSESYKSMILNSAISINIYMVLLGIVGFIVGFSVSLGPVMWAMFSEIFPNYIRAKAISFVGAANAFTSFLVATIFPIELEYMGSANTYLIYGVFMALCFLFVYRYIPETKEKSLEDLELELIRH